MASTVQPNMIKLAIRPSLGSSPVEITEIKASSDARYRHPNAAENTAYQTRDHTGVENGADATAIPE
ncbi:hypothetical protein J3459_014671 [Metarhizium acridum]|nr:hypothetical protein J3459_014755 [Metarhizium acridum]KAG8414511.1 hypothetical protein J3459_014671 [Metarhizium acridum]